MNKNIRFIYKWYIQPLFKEIVETVKKFIKDNNISFKTVKEKLKEEKEKSSK